MDFGGFEKRRTTFAEKAAVTRALEEFIARREQARNLDLLGMVEIGPSYDYKAERSRG